MNIASTIYHTICRYAEGGKRVVSVKLPTPLWEEYYTEDDGMKRMFKVLRVSIVDGGKIAEPEFEVKP